MAKLTYNQTEHSNGLPSSYRLSLLPAYFLPKIGDNGSDASHRTVRRASHDGVFRRTR